MVSIVFEFADALTPNQQQALLRVLANITGLPLASFRINVGRKRMSTVTVTVTDPNAAVAANDITTDISENPDLLTPAHSMASLCAPWRLIVPKLN